MVGLLVTKPVPPPMLAKVRKVCGHQQEKTCQKADELPVNLSTCPAIPRSVWLVLEHVFWIPLPIHSAYSQACMWTTQERKGASFVSCGPQFNREMRWSFIVTMVNLPANTDKAIQKHITSIFYTLCSSDSRTDRGCSNHSCTPSKSAPGLVPWLHAHSYATEAIAGHNSRTRTRGKISQCWEHRIRNSNIKKALFQEGRQESVIGNSQGDA